MHSESAGLAHQSRPQGHGAPPRPHPLARAALVDRMNGWLTRAWERGLCTRPTLYPDALWAKAAGNASAIGETGGRTAEDVADFRLRLERLCDSLQCEAALNPLGLTLAHGQLVRVIRQRLALGARWQRQPELIAQPVAAPIIVLGQMRSGTTRVHRLLASDPRHAGTRFCDSWHPCPPTGWSPDSRPLWSALSLFLARRFNPWLDTIHPFGVTRSDEELGWLAAGLDHCAYEAQWRVPAFTAFSEARGSGPVYREFDRILRTDAAFRGNAHRPRVLKVPQFAEDLPALLALFPGASVVRTQRDLAQVAASAVSLVSNQMAIQSDAADLAWIEAECRRKIALREARMDAALHDFEGKLVEVAFGQLNRDWEAQMLRVYGAFGLPLTEDAVHAMRREQERSAGSAHASHGATYHRFAKLRATPSNTAS